VSNAADGVMPQLLTAGNTGAAAHVAAAGAQAGAAFGAAVDALNTRHAGASVLAGTSVRGPSVAGADTMLDRIVTLAGPGADAATLQATAEAWFAPGGGFETDGWLGTGPADPVRLGPDAGALGARPPDAADPRLRDTLSGLAMGALVGRGLPADPAGRAALAEVAGSRLAAAAEPRAALRADLGLLESVVAQADTQNIAARAALELARNDMLGADPYTTATALQDTQTRIETLYLMTARLARLNLAEYLR
jgi:flagellar hook-associated protein 3 FlgL